MAGFSNAWEAVTLRLSAVDPSIEAEMEPGKRRKPPDGHFGAGNSWGFDGFGPGIESSGEHLGRD